MPGPPSACRRKGCEHVLVTDMQRVDDPGSVIAWLNTGPERREEWVTGFEVDDWPASTWVLHAMYENPDLVALGSHEDLHQRWVDVPHGEPGVVAGIDLRTDPMLTLGSLGYSVRPDSRWQRVTWADYLARFPRLATQAQYRPSLRWFPYDRWPEDWPVALEPPPDGSLDEVSMNAIIATLAAHSIEGPDTRCYAFYASVHTEDRDHTHLWEGPLRSVSDLIADNGGPYYWSPSNIWPADRAWFVYTHADLCATKVSGTEALIGQLRSDHDLECLDWPPRK